MFSSSKREFAEQGTSIRSLNDRGDDSPEGQLSNAILDQLAKFERAKMAERSRRGKIQKARQGKVLATHTPNFGFRHNPTRDSYEVDEDAMRVVRRIFRMIGEQGYTLYAVMRTLEKEGVPTPNGGRFWAAKVLRTYVLDDVYCPYSPEELRVMVDAGQMAPEVFGRLDPEKRYGVWWFNRRRTRQTQVSEVGPNGERVYKKKTRYVYRPREEWVAVPVPDSGIPRQWVDAAREIIGENRRPSAAGRRVWELSSLLRCGECGWNMMIQSVSSSRLAKPDQLYYYRCRKRNRHGVEACNHKKCHRADLVESRVWGFVSDLLKDPQRLRAGLEELIEAERGMMRGDPEQEAKTWLEQLTEVDEERRGYLRLAAKGHITDEELDEALAEIQETRQTAERELEVLRTRSKALEELERDRDTLLESYAGMVCEGIDLWTPEERCRVYRMLRLRAIINPDGSVEVTGVFGDSFVSENQDERLARAQHLPRRRREANVEIVGVHATSLA